MENVLNYSIWGKRIIFNIWVTGSVTTSGAALHYNRVRGRHRSLNRHQVSESFQHRTGLRMSLALSFHGEVPRHTPTTQTRLLQLLGPQCAWKSLLCIYTLEMSVSQITSESITFCLHFPLKALFLGKSQPLMEKYMIVNKRWEKSTHIFRLGLELCQ